MHWKSIWFDSEKWTLIEYKLHARKGGIATVREREGAQVDSSRNGLYNKEYSNNEFLFLASFPVDSRTAVVNDFFFFLQQNIFLNERNTHKSQNRLYFCISNIFDHKKRWKIMEPKKIW